MPNLIFWTDFLIALDSFGFFTAFDVTLNIRLQLEVLLI